MARVNAASEEKCRELEERLEDREEAVERVAERLRRRELQLESTSKSLEHSEQETRRLQDLLDMERSKHSRTGFVAVSRWSTITTWASVIVKGSNTGNPVVDGERLDFESQKSWS